jgi:hypothetical protein
MEKISALLDFVSDSIGQSLGVSKVAIIGIDAAYGKKRRTADQSVACFMRVWSQYPPELRRLIVFVSLI